MNRALLRSNVSEHGRVIDGALREYTNAVRGALREELATPGRGGVMLARRHADVADELVRAVFAEVRCACENVPVLLGAVGGYGRRRLALGSDLDLCFVTTGPREQVGECMQAMLYPLWDAGIQIGHQIVHPWEVAQDASADIAMATELLDFRPLAGDEALLHEMNERLSDSVFSDEKIRAFIDQLEAGARRRHEKFGDSVYLLEPDVKSGTGGLRDLDSAIWATRARFGKSTLGALEAEGIISAMVCAETSLAIDFIWTVRNHLHAGSGRKSDRLTFGEQERVAEAMGYALPDQAGAPKLQRIGEMVEAFMSDYYRHARVVTHTRARLLGRAKRGAVGSLPEPTPLGGGLVECDGRIGLDHPDSVREDPSVAFAIYERAVRENRQVLSRTRDAIALSAGQPAFAEQLRASPEAVRIFVKLVCSSRPSPFSSGSILTELHEVGLLLAMIPEFAPVVGRVHHDLYHVYTVDVHSIAAVDKLHRLARGDLVTQYPLATRLAAESVQPRVLYMATLLHDVGKAIGGRNHAKRGAEMVKTILARLGYSPEEIEDVSRLVYHHLTMYMVAVRRDLNDPATISEFVRDTWDRDSLRDLFLLTLADVATTSSDAMTSWKLNMLNALYRSSDAYLAGALPGSTSRAERVRERVRTLWPAGSERFQLESFLGSMPDRYFVANTAEEVVAHAALALSRSDDGVVVAAVPSPHTGIMCLCVAAELSRWLEGVAFSGWRPGLLAAIAAAISASQFDIQAAQINSRRLASGDYQAFDSFWVRTPADEQTTERRLAKLEGKLKALVKGTVTPESVVANRLGAPRSSRPGPPVPTEVLFDHHASEEYTVIEVLAEDRPALLYRLCSAISELGIVIGVAKISTEGTRAVDVLYVAESDGSKLAIGARVDDVRAALLAALAA